MDRIGAFDEQRGRLFAIAYRMCGSAQDAEDLVQEAWLRWEAADLSALESPRAYLSAVITRLSIDHLRAAQRKREDYIGPWLPEPILTETPAEAAALADSLSFAFLTLLESLAPVERAAFLLREAFDYDYAEIARILDKSEAACRQIVKRAHDRLREGRPRFEVRGESHQRLMAEFGLACYSGDLNGLLSLLSEDVVLYSDGGGKVSAARNPILGPDHVARFLLGIRRFMPPDTSIRPMSINGGAAWVTYYGLRPHAILVLAVAGGRVARLYTVSNPDKLKLIPPLAE